MLLWESGIVSVLIEYKAVMVTGIVAPRNKRNWLANSIKIKIYKKSILSSPADVQLPE